jgi:Fe(3+) dicitrate transport protein
MRKNIALMVALMGTIYANAQVRDPLTWKDSIKTKYLSDVTVVGRGSKTDYQQMPEIVGTSIYAGKKNALIVLDNVQGNVSNNTMRQVLAKVPGIHVWESDPSGIQIGIAARGLSPNRSWEFNIRQNGYDIAADPFGYPEAYYNPQLQAVQRIEVVRGAGALQYGAQFGGMVNYILRNGSEINKKFEFETQQTVGSNGLFNSYNAIGGKSKKVHYYSFFDHRNGDGYRDNSRFYTDAGFGTVTYSFSPKISLTAEVMHSHIRSQQAGGLTDKQFDLNTQQSFRSRNWFDITWTNPALIFNYQINNHTLWNTKLFATIGNRNSVGYLPAAGIIAKDSINPATGTYNKRALNKDQYRNFGLESRIITDYTLAGLKNTLSGGIRLYTGSTHRLADPNNKPSGTTGLDYDLSQTSPYLRDITFESRNGAAFVENVFRLTKKLLLIPGIRYEWLQGNANGQDVNSSGNPVTLQNVTRSRGFAIAGVGSEYHVSKSTEVYANYTQAYRPIQFANLQAPPTTNVIDPDLEDSKGYNLDLGYRGKIKGYLQFDVSGFYLQYNNRVGNVAVSSPTGNYTLVTNVGASTSKGIESYADINLLRIFQPKEAQSSVIIFGSYSYLDASYSSDHKDASTKGKRVENAPSNIFRGGLSVGCHNFLITGQLSYTDKTFSDATNTVAPSANGNNGLIPSYKIADLTAAYKVSSQVNLKAGINNVFDENYFTRRAGGYPGPGLLPGDGRTFFVSVGAKL